MEHALARYRKQANLSRSDLAKAAGTTRQTIHRIENREQQPSWDLASRIIEMSAGAVSADDFMPAPAKPEERMAS